MWHSKVQSLRFTLDCDPFDEADSNPSNAIVRGACETPLSKVEDASPITADARPPQRVFSLEPVMPASYFVSSPLEVEVMDLVSLPFTTPPPPSYAMELPAFSPPIPLGAGCCVLAELIADESAARTAPACSTSVAAVEDTGSFHFATFGSVLTFSDSVAASRTSDRILFTVLCPDLQCLQGGSSSKGGKEDRRCCCALGEAEDGPSSPSRGRIVAHATLQVYSKDGILTTGACFLRLTPPRRCPANNALCTSEVISDLDSRLWWLEEALQRDLHSLESIRLHGTTDPLDRFAALRLAEQMKETLAEISRTCPPPLPSCLCNGIGRCYLSVVAQPRIRRLQRVVLRDDAVYYRRFPLLPALNFPPSGNPQHRLLPVLKKCENSLLPAWTICQSPYFSMIPHPITTRNRENVLPLVFAAPTDGIVGLFPVVVPTKTSTVSPAAEEKISEGDETVLPASPRGPPLTLMKFPPLPLPRHIDLCFLAADSRRAPRPLPRGESAFRPHPSWRRVLADRSKLLPSLSPPSPHEMGILCRVVALPEPTLSLVEEHHRELLWRHRWFLIDQPAALSKVLRCVDWYNEDEVEEMRELLRRWSSPDTLVGCLEFFAMDFVFRRSGDSSQCSRGAVDAIAAERLEAASREIRQFGVTSVAGVLRSRGVPAFAELCEFIPQLVATLQCEDAITAADDQGSDFAILGPFLVDLAIHGLETVGDTSHEGSSVHLESKRMFTVALFWAFTCEAQARHTRSICTALLQRLMLSLRRHEDRLRSQMDSSDICSRPVSSEEQCLVTLIDEQIRLVRSLRFLARALVDPAAVTGILPATTTRNLLEIRTAADRRTTLLRELLVKIHEAKAGDPGEPLANILDLLEPGQPAPLPFDTRELLLGVDPNSSLVMKSSQYPILLCCNVRSRLAQTSRRTFIMYKQGDDLRQDAFAVQMINAINRTLLDMGLKLHIVTYRVHAYSKSDGLIEFVPHTKPLSTVKREFQGAVKEYFAHLSHLRTIEIYQAALRTPQSGPHASQTAAEPAPMGHLEFPEEFSAVAGGENDAVAEEDTRSFSEEDEFCLTKTVDLPRPRSWNSLFKTEVEGEHFQPILTTSRSAPNILSTEGTSRESTSCFPNSTPADDAAAFPVQEAGDRKTVVADSGGAEGGRVDPASAAEEGLDVSSPMKHGTAIQQRTVHFSRLLSRFISSTAGYSVITFLLGVGDRHLDNLLVDSQGRFCHVDYGFLFGEDPKPFPPMMKVCREMNDVMGGQGSTGFEQFRWRCVEAFLQIRRFAANQLLTTLLLAYDMELPSCVKMETRLSKTSSTPSRVSVIGDFRTTQAVLAYSQDLLEFLVNEKRHVPTVPEDTAVPAGEDAVPQPSEDGGHPSGSEDAAGACEASSESSTRILGIRDKESLLEGGVPPNSGSLLLLGRRATTMPSSRVLLDFALSKLRFDLSDAAARTYLLEEIISPSVNALMPAMVDTFHEFMVTFK